MSKSILLITPYYPIPSPNNKATKVCHYFAKEWTMKGNKVMVIHQMFYHSHLWQLAYRLFKSQINNRFGGGLFYNERMNKLAHYQMEGVNVYRVPVYKFVPKGRLKTETLNKFADDIKIILEKESFVPDIIVGHDAPIDLIPQLNDIYHAKTCFVWHGVSLKFKARYKNINDIIASYDLLAYRSEGIKNAFEKQFGSFNPSFICRSGIPELFVLKQPIKKFENVLSKFIYVGSLIERKYPSALLKAIPASNCKSFDITYVGEGPELINLKTEVKQRSLDNKVCFTGNLKRDEIISLYDKSDCFIMISRNEAFGLVYLEAMARGCIVVASKNEGIDGVIKDGVNGFLCEAGNSEELTNIINRIQDLSPSELQVVSNNAMNTAKIFTDQKMAEDYLTKLNNI